MTKRAIAVLVTALTVAACSHGAAPKDMTAGKEDSRSTVSTTSTTTRGAQQDYQDAVDATLAAGSYRFEAHVTVYPASGPLEVTLSGWVDGKDRQLTTEAKGQKVVTLVKAGSATVTDSNGSHTVPLSEAPSAPSLQVLADLDLSSVASGVARGTLPASLLAGLGVDASGKAATATVYYAGYVTGYQLADPGSTWKIDASFSDFGNHFDA